MSPRAVLDASAILVLLLNEPGADKLTDDVMIRSGISTVNLAEANPRNSLTALSKCAMRPSAAILLEDQAALKTLHLL